MCCTTAWLDHDNRFPSLTFQGLNSFSLMFYNGVLALPMCLALASLTGEVGASTAFPYWSDPAFISGLIISSAMGVMLTYAIFLCTTSNSPLATRCVPCPVVVAVVVATPPPLPCARK